jgi:regulator of PEP synthase PpsR (kinase-PPPase family)
MGTHVPGYAERRHIASEIDYCNRLYRTIPGIRTVNVTNRSIEETSDWITHNVI